MGVREPVTRLISDFTQISHNRREKGLASRTFDETMIRADGTVDTDYYGVDTGLYARHLNRWYEHFPRDQIHVVNGDRLIKTPWREVAAVEKFLGLEAEVTQENFYFNATKGFHCLRPGRGLGPLPRRLQDTTPDLTDADPNNDVLLPRRLLDTTP